MSPFGACRERRSARSRCGFQKTINTEALGAELIDALSPYERRITAFASVLFQKGIPTPEDLAVRMQQAEARWDRKNQ